MPIKTFIFAILISTHLPVVSFANDSLESFSKSCRTILGSSNGETSLVLAAKNACLQMPNARAAQNQLNAVKNGVLSDKAFVTRRLSQIVVVSSLLDAGLSPNQIGDSTESVFDRAGENALRAYLPHLMKDIGFQESDINPDSLENLRSRMAGDLTNRSAIYALSYFLAEQVSL